MERAIQAQRKISPIPISIIRPVGVLLRVVVGHGAQKEDYRKDEDAVVEFLVEENVAKRVAPWGVAEEFAEGMILVLERGFGGGEGLGCGRGYRRAIAEGGFGLLGGFSEFRDAGGFRS